jgi:hypothetical protein
MSDETMKLTMQRGGAEFHTIRAGLSARLRELAADERTFADSYRGPLSQSDSRGRDEAAAALEILMGAIRSERQTIATLLRKLDAALYEKEPV